MSLVRTAELWCNSVSGFLRIAELCDLHCSSFSKLQNCAELGPLYPSSWAEASKSCFWSLALKPHVSFAFSLANCSVWAPGAPGGFWGIPGPLWAAWVAWGCLQLSWGSPGARLVHSCAVVVKVVLVVVVVAPVVVVVVVVVAVGRTRGCWSGLGD